MAKQMNLAVSNAPVSNAPGSLGRSLLAFSARVLVCSGCLWSFEFPPEVISQLLPTSTTGMTQIRKPRVGGAVYLGNSL